MKTITPDTGYPEEEYADYQLKTYRIMKSFIGAIIFICVALSANAQLLWKVSGNGLSSPSYIMGTHHLAPLSIKDGITGLQKAMDETQQVYGELKMSEIQSQATIQKMQKMMMMFFYMQNYQVDLRLIHQSETIIRTGRLY